MGVGCTAAVVISSVMQINWAMNDKQEFIDIVETVYRGARKGRGLVVSPKGELHYLCTLTVSHGMVDSCRFSLGRSLV
jgi:hypothetical protein